MCRGSFQLVGKDVTGWNLANEGSRARVGDVVAILGGLAEELLRCDKE
jgi:hypothetical protein